MITSMRAIWVPDGLGQPRQRDARAWHIHQPPFPFKEEVMMLGDIGVEPAAAGIDRHLTQQAGGGELVQGVIDRGKAYAHACRHSLIVQRLGGDMAVGAGKQQAGKRQALALAAARPQPAAAEGRQRAAQRQDRDDDQSGSWSGTTRAIKGTSLRAPVERRGPGAAEKWRRQRARLCCPPVLSTWVESGARHGNVKPD
jgi:hypothetical protein